MFVFANFWPVWKNIYTDYHLKSSTIPADVKKMSSEEENKKDYRAVCKKCFIYLKKNEK